MSAPPGMSSNPFEVLGLDRSASFEDVKLAYRRLARQHHPDANPDDPQALERFTALRRAYDRLKIFYQTLDAAGPVERPARASESVQEGAARATGLVAGQAPQPAPPQPAAAAPAPASPRTTMPEQASPATDGRYESMPEPAVPGTGSRRAFRRTGPMRQSGDIGEQPPVTPAPADRAAPTAASARAAGARLPAPVQIGNTNLAARAEVLYGQAALGPGSAPQMLYALLGLRPSDGIAFPRLPLNLALVLDHSSSMLRGGKVDRLKDTVRQIIDLLDPDDFLAIVTFGDRAEVLLPAQPVRDKAAAQGAIEAIRCRGGTEIARGLGVGLAELGRHAARALSHLILLTDGQTYGDEMLCLERAEEAARHSVGISAYGLGADWNSALLDGIAGATGGLSDYIATPEGMAEAFGARVRSLQATTLCNVRLRVAAAAGCSVRRLTLVTPLLRPLELSAEEGRGSGQAGDSGSGSVALGDISSTDEYRVLVELAVGPRERAAGTMPLAELRLCYDVPGLQREGEALRIPLALPVTAETEPEGQPSIDPRVADVARQVTVHRMQQQAWAEIRSGDLPKGTGLLRRAAEHLEVAGHSELAQVAVAEAARVEAGDSASDENIKRIIYGTRKLG